MKRFNVLVFPAGKENSLEILAALKDSMNITLFGASSKVDHGLFAFNNYISNAPFIFEEDFIPRFNQILDDNSIDVIFPTHDTISMYLSEHASLLHAKVAAPRHEACTVARYKDKTYDFFAGESFCPEFYRSPTEVKFPAFVKPIVGEAAQNARLVKDANELSSISNLSDYVVTELLPGNELTVDCFTDRHGVMRFAGPRTRGRLHTGISLNSKSYPLTEEIKYIADCISEKLGMRGLWFFQIKQDAQGVFKLLEVSVRTAGTMCLYRQLGINFPLLTVYDLMDIDFHIHINNMDIEVDRALANKFKISYEFDKIYIDFDDTVTRQGKPNEFVMLFLYNMRNKGKKIILVTRHEYNLDETLSRLAISKNLFDEIIHITWEYKKSHQIKDIKRAIFIDNSFAERIEVAKHTGMPVFDVDAIGCLVDWTA